MSSSGMVCVMEEVGPFAIDSGFVGGTRAPGRRKGEVRPPPAPAVEEGHDDNGGGGGGGERFLVDVGVASEVEVVVVENGIEKEHCSSRCCSSSTACVRWVVRVTGTLWADSFSTGECNEEKGEEDDTDAKVHFGEVVGGKEEEEEVIGGILSSRESAPSCFFSGARGEPAPPPPPPSLRRWRRECGSRSSSRRSLKMLQVLLPITSVTEVEGSGRTDLDSGEEDRL